jgi:hypothetical protein
LKLTLVATSITELLPFRAAGALEGDEDTPTRGVSGFQIPEQGNPKL